MSCSIIREEIGQNLNFTVKVAFLFKNFCFQHHKSRKNDLITSIAFVIVFSWPFQTVPWGLLHSLMREKKAKNISSLERLPFFKKFCFQQPPRCYRTDLVTSTVIAKKPWEPLRMVPWGLSHSIIGEKIGQNLFFTGKTGFFFKIFVFNKPLGPKEMI